MAKLLNILYLIAQALTFILNKFAEKRTEEKYEEARNDTVNQWADGFGVRKEVQNDPTKADTEH